MQAPDREVTFVEVVVHQAKELPVMDTNATASPYVILWREGAEKEKHKSKVIKKELNPRWNETFGFKFPTVDENAPIQDSVVIELNEYNLIGSPTKVGKLTIPLHDLRNEEQREAWYDMECPGARRAKIPAKFQIELYRYRVVESEAPVPIKSHTGNSMKSFYNSITRTQQKKARRGDRGGATTGAYIEVTVQEGRNLVAGDRNGLSDPYVIVQLNSTDKIRHKTSVVKSNLSPKWSNQVFGFEVTNVHPTGYLQDQLKVSVYNWNVASDDSFMGIAYVKLNDLKENEPVDVWVKLEEVDRGEIRLTLRRSTKTAAELDDIMNQSIFKAINKKMLYAFNIVKLKLKELNLVCTVSIDVELVAITLSMSVSVGGGDETIEQLQVKLGQAEQAVEESGGLEGAVVTSADKGAGASPPSVTKDKGFMSRAIDKMFKGLQSNIAMMKANSITGTVGASANITAFGAGICIGVEMAID